MVKVSPSLLSADLSCLKSVLETLNKSEADMVHIDVMDGVFVPNITFGFPFIKTVSKLTDLPLDVHLMIVDPGKYVSQCRDCGTTIMNVHVEACTHLDRVIHQIKQAGMRAAVTLNPATPLCMLEDIINEVDMVLLMSVNPGFSGQDFISYIIDKTRRLKEMIYRSGSHALIEVDGGINEVTGKAVVEAGADIIVAGSHVFKSVDPVKVISQLRAL